MKNAEIIALAKVMKEKAVKEASQELEAGRYELDMLVRILGSFTKGEDYETTVPNKINFTLLAAMALSKVNIETRNSIIDEFITAMENPEELEKLAEEIKVGVQKKLDKIKGMTKTTATGKVTTDLSAEVVGAAKIVRIAKDKT